MAGGLDFAMKKQAIFLVILFKLFKMINLIKQFEYIMNLL